MRADVTNFKYPLLAQRSLHREVPLLRARNDEVSWHGQAKDAERLERTGATCARRGSIVRRLRRVAAGEALEDVQARHKVGIDRARLGQWVGIRIWAARTGRR